MGSEFRVVIASIAAFMTLAGAFATIHGLLYDRANVMNGGVITVLFGILFVVVMLTPWARDEDRETPGKP
jgi:heme/copper-type cytochrome/quinol oxidase subunit 3